MFGIYDKAQLQRGFQVYKEVCSTCHALSIPFRTLADPDGPGFSEDQIKTLAATYQITNAEPNEKGEIFKRPTLMFNGYGDQVASLYTGMDLKKNY